MAEMKLQKAPAKLLSKNEAGWIAVNIVTLPEMSRVSFFSFVAIIPCELEHLHEDLKLTVRLPPLLPALLFLLRYSV